MEAKATTPDMEENTILYVVFNFYLMAPILIVFAVSLFWFCRWFFPTKYSCPEEQEPPVAPRQSVRSEILNSSPQPLIQGLGVTTRRQTRRQEGVQNSMRHDYVQNSGRQEPRREASERQDYVQNPVRQNPKRQVFKTPSRR